MSNFSIDTGGDDNIYQPSPVDPTSGVHGIAEEDDTIVVDLEATEAGVIDLASRVAIKTWSPSATVKLRQFVQGSNGTLVQCTIGGQTGNTQPAWPSTQGAAITDGGATWLVLAVPGSAAALAAETVRAEAAETNLGTAITAETTRAETAEALLAPKASPALTGAPTAPTPTAGDNSTKVATTAFVTTATGAYVGTPSGAAVASTMLLLAWTASQSFTVTTATRNSNEAITTASVVWPDGGTGTYTADTLSSAFPGATDAYHVTYVSPGGGLITHTVTQSAVTRDTGGAVTAQPALTVV